MVSRTQADSSVLMAGAQPSHVAAARSFPHEVEAAHWLCKRDDGANGMAIIRTAARQVWHDNVMVQLVLQAYYAFRYCLASTSTSSFARLWSSNWRACLCA